MVTSVATTTHHLHLPTRRRPPSAIIITAVRRALCGSSISGTPPRPRHPSAQLVTHNNRPHLLGAQADEVGAGTWEVWEGGRPTDFVGWDEPDEANAYWSWRAEKVP
jgi:hypothetical protein